jgi:hypothetical protein
MTRSKSMRMTRSKSMQITRRKSMRMPSRKKESTNENYAKKLGKGVPKIWKSHATSGAILGGPHMRAMWDVCIYCVEAERKR